jgi:tellurite methyltransferase
MAQDWKVYITKTKNGPPRSLLIRAVDFVENKNLALDLGAGALNDTKFLLEKGFNKVIALDQDNIGQEIFEALPKDKVDYLISTYDKYDFPTETFDIINAQFALPFNPPNTFNLMFAKLKSSLKNKGIFAGQFFGVRDEWHGLRPEMSFHALEQIEELLSGMEIIEIKEEEKDDKPVVGNNIKHWHVFHVIARKK